MPGMSQWLFCPCVDHYPLAAFATDAGEVTDIVMWADPEYTGEAAVNFDCYFTDGTFAAPQAQYSITPGDGYVRIPFDDSTSPHVITPYSGPKPILVGLGDALYVAVPDGPTTFDVCFGITLVGTGDLTGAVEAADNVAAGIMGIGHEVGRILGQ